MVYAKEPFGGPEAVLAYLSRYTHRVAISNRRLIKVDKNGVTFKWKDYRIEGSGPLQNHDPAAARVYPPLPDATSCPGGSTASAITGCWQMASRATNIATARELLGVPLRSTDPKEDNKCHSPGSQTYRLIPARVAAGA